jgi:DNA-binding CsgD family transcriptional regulator
MLDAMATPMFACARNANIVYANTAAEALLRENDGLSSEGRRLAGVAPAVTERLRQAIATAAKLQANDVRTDAGTLKLPRRSAAEHLTLNIAPLPQQWAGLGDKAQGPAVLVTVQREKTFADFARAGLLEAYDLTDAELRLLCALSGGGALPEVARRLGIRHTTARTHLQHIFDKTQTHRQAELLALVRRISH